MKEKPFVLFLLIMIVLILFVSILKIIDVNKEMDLVKQENRELRRWQVDSENCYDYLSNNENLVILEIDDIEEDNELLGS